MFHFFKRRYIFCRCGLGRILYGLVHFTFGLKILHDISVKLKFSPILFSKSTEFNGLGPNQESYDNLTFNPKRNNLLQY